MIGAFEMSEYTALKQLALERYFSKMNDKQREAVFQVKGAVLILAGAGSGKTTVLVNRIANMIFFGDAYCHGEPCDISKEDIDFLRRYADGAENDGERLREIIAYDCVEPWNILAITFTNKAAGELKERLENMLGEAGQGLTAATFHSACVRILRRECDRLGYSKSFTIYDADDQKRLIKDCLAELGVSDKMFPPRSLIAEISSAKDKLIYPQQYAKINAGDYRKNVYAQVYALYQKKLEDASAMDFDDLIGKTIELFERFPDVLEHYQNRYKYILVDEYQDTNAAQYKLVSLLSQKYKNLCVVGDDDQSIYKFRGATIENILQFENQFDNCKVIRLEQNYRSTQNILTCANVLIQNNSERKGKKLWTAMGDGDKVCVYKAASTAAEAKFVAETVLQGVKDGGRYGDNAVLYRTNAQSNALEQAMISGGIPYKIFGGVKFYDRKEIRDILAYLHVIDNNSDMLRFKRIVNEPKRKIGEATVATIEQISSDIGDDPITVMRDSRELAPLSKKANQLTDLAAMFDYLKEISESVPLDELLDELMDKSGYLDMLLAQGDEGQTRLENINELKSNMVTYAEEAEEPSLSGFLEEISLYTDIDSLEESADYVAMMTMHAAKGLEFPTVFVVGMEDQLFPSRRSVEEGNIEEERRLAYVAITRAEKKLYLTYAKERLIYGNLNRATPSRFLSELPKENVEKQTDPSLDTASYRSSGYTSVTSGGDKSSASAFVRGAAAVKPAKLTESFSAGDRVSHKIFGEGTVLSAVPTAADVKLEIAFDKAGTKKIMAAFAKITKL